eukprot:4624773-Prymnesium_polylepis.1
MGAGGCRRFWQQPAQRKAHVHDGECATRVHMLERELRPRCDARACALCWRMGRGRRFAIH